MPRLKIFIDGGQGATGLKIRKLIQARDDLEILEIEECQKKELSAKLEIFDQADAVILCLPDESSIELLPHLKRIKGKVIDTSTAFRTDPEWAYGLPELGSDYREAIRNSKLTANPGCYPTGFNLIMRPLVKEKLLEPNISVYCFATSGYSGGGKKMITEFESQTLPPFFHYALNLEHKHLKEMRFHSGLTRIPFFQPSVAPVFSGMLVSVILDRDKLDGDVDQIRELYQKYYHSKCLIRIHQNRHERLSILENQNSNFVDLHVFNNKDYLEITACLDNLGKGASGAAMHNLNIMLGLQNEYEGLIP